MDLGSSPFGFSAAWRSLEIAAVPASEDEAWLLFITVRHTRLVAWWLEGLGSDELAEVVVTRRRRLTLMLAA